jgi:hypothetical protein
MELREGGGQKCFKEQINCNNVVREKIVIWSPFLFVQELA